MDFLINLLVPSMSVRCLFGRKSSILPLILIFTRPDIIIILPHLITVLNVVIHVPIDLGPPATPPLSDLLFKDANSIKHLFRGGTHCSVDLLIKKIIYEIKFLMLLNKIIIPHRCIRIIKFCLTAITY